MAIKNLLIKIMLTSAFIWNVYADANMVAKVIILRGQVKAKLSDGTMIDVKQDQDIPEGAILQTAEKSFVKLIFIDKSQMNLGPSSQMAINAFPKKEAGIITLMKGQIRSQVTKDYMEMDDKSKSKLYIKTNTAAMGIRGTDFQVNFNPENQNTALITFEGAVAMSHIEKGIREEKFDQNKLEKVVSNEKSVMVTAGHISAVNLNVAERAMVPTKLAPTQIDALKDNENGMKENNQNSNESKQFRNPIPPGAEGTVFSNSPSEVDKMVKGLGVNPETIKPEKDASKDKYAATKSDPNGFFNEKTGEYKLPAGSIIDLKTVNLIPPPVNAVFDPNTKTYNVPDNFGKVDRTTGEYKAPEGLKLNSDGKFQVVDPEAFKKVQPKVEGQKPKEMNEQGAIDPKKDGRMPASIGEGPQPMGGMVPPSLNDIRPDMQKFSNQFSPVIMEKNPVMNDQLKSIVQDKISTTEKVNQDLSNTTNSSSFSKTKFIINAQ